MFRKYCRLLTAATTATPPLSTAPLSVQQKKARAREIYLSKNTHYIDVQELITGITEATSWTELVRAVAIAASTREVDTVYSHVMFRLQKGLLPPVECWRTLIESTAYCDIERECLGYVVPIDARTPRHDGSVTLEVIQYMMKNPEVSVTDEIIRIALEALSERHGALTGLTLLRLSQEKGILTEDLLILFVNRFLKYSTCEVRVAYGKLLLHVCEPSPVQYLKSLITFSEVISQIACRETNMSTFALSELLPCITNACTSEEHLQTKFDASTYIFRVVAREGRTETPDVFQQLQDCRTARLWGEYITYLVNHGSSNVSSAVDELRSFALAFGKSVSQSTEQDRKAFQDAHEVVLQHLCRDESNLVNVNSAYNVLLVHRSFGLMVNTTMCNALLRPLSEHGDARVFGLVDITVTASHCNVDVLTLEYVFRTCQVAKDYNRALSIYNTMKTNLPSLSQRLTPRTKLILEELGIEKSSAPHLFQPNVKDSAVPLLSKK